MDLTIKPIAYIKTDFCQKFGIPRQSGRVKSLRAKVIFLPEYRNKEALREIESFSHLWLIFDFSESHREEWSPTVRPPRLGGNKRVGVFASRSPFRPNPLGLSCVELIKVDYSKEYGYYLEVGGADLLDDTPILDIKPYIRYSDSKPDAVSGYADKEERYSLNVVYDEKLLDIVPIEKREALISCLKEDPRPSYQDDDRIYSMNFAGIEVRFTVKDDNLTIVETEEKMY